MTIFASRRKLLTVIAGLPFMTAMSGMVPQNPFSNAGESDRRMHGRRFGSAIRPDQLSTEGPLLSAIRQCDILVPEYHGQWSAMEWKKGEPWFGNYDMIVEFSRLHGQMVRGHSLIWEQMTPGWAREDMSDHRSWRTIERHFSDLLPRYSGQIAEWVVVNEMIDTEDGHHDMRRTSFQRAYGNDYVARALETARVLDPHARLMINEYALYHDNPVDEARRNALLRLVERLKARNVPLNMVGIQGHIELAKKPASQKRMAQFFRDLAATGVELALTELDILEDDRSLPVEQRDARVADAAAHLLEVVENEPAMKSVVTWGLSDRHSWLQERSPMTQMALACLPLDSAKLNRGLPFDAAMQPKRFRDTLAAATAPDNDVRRS